MPGGNLFGDKTVREIAAMLRWWRSQPKTRPHAPSSGARFAANLPKLVRADGGCPSGSSGTFDVYHGTPGSESATGEQITAWNKGSVGIVNNGWAIAWHNSRAWYVSSTSGAQLLDFALEEYLDRSGTAEATVDGVADVTITDAFGYGPARTGRKGIVARVPTDSSPANDIYVIFSLDQDRLVRGIAGETISKGGDGNVSIASGTCGSESSMGITVTACSPYGDVTNGNQVFLNYDTEDDMWVIVATECD